MAATLASIVCSKLGFVISLWLQHASAEDLGAWVPIGPVERPAWIVGTVWLKDGERCVPAKVEDAAKARLAARVCAEGTLACDVELTLDPGLDLVGERCRAGGTRGDEVVAPLDRPHTEPLALVRADGEVAAYQPAVTLQVTVPTRLEVRQACTRQSLRRLERSVGDGGLAALGIEDGFRTCDATREYAVVPVTIGTAGPPGGVGTTTTLDPVDCEVPCPDNPVLAEIAELERTLAEARFAPREAAPVTIHRTEAACRAAPPAPAVLPADTCARLGPRLPR